MWGVQRHQKYESVSTYSVTNGRTGVGARDAQEPKNVNTTTQLVFSLVNRKSNCPIVFLLSVTNN